VVVERDTTGARLPDFYRLLEESVKRWAEQSHEPLLLARWRARRRDPLEKFQAMLRNRVEARRNAAPGATSFADIDGELENPERGILFHDGNNRSMEQLMSDQAKNALLHNMVVELLKKQYSAMENALRERAT